MVPVDVDTGARVLADREIETGLAAALIEGISESPPWSSFLRRLRDAADADYAILVVQSPRRPFKDALRLFSGDALEEDVEDSFAQYFRASEPLSPPRMIEGRPYSLPEMLDEFGGGPTDFHRAIVGAREVTGVRGMHVKEMSGIDAWLTLARRSADFTDREEAVMRSVAPVLRSALKLYVSTELERFAASVSAEAVRRLRCGWLTLDRAGHILESDEQGELLLASSNVLGRSAFGRLTAKPPRLEATIHQTLNSMAQSPSIRPHAFTLSRDPWLDMLLAPVRGGSMSAKAAPVAIAYVHGDSWRSTERCEQLADLFALSPGEARMALSLSQGMTIAEAAADLGLTIGSARNRSKAIYTKTGARGLPDLVRIVMGSILAIAPRS